MRYADILGQVDFKEEEVLAVMKNNKVDKSWWYQPLAMRQQDCRRLEEDLRGLQGRIYIWKRI